MRVRDHSTEKTQNIPSSIIKPIAIVLVGEAPGPGRRGSGDDSNQTPTRPVASASGSAPRPQQAEGAQIGYRTTEGQCEGWRPPWAPPASAWSRRHRGR
eukprot:scaffold22496_cov27-Tisochrysis_lutea.AAC.3